jgi:hypothetical protein
MKYETGKLYTAYTLMGEIVGKYVDEDEHTITLENPMLFVPATDAGSGGFSRGLCMTGELEPEQVALQRTLVLALIRTHEDIAAGYREITSGIVLPTGA